MANGFTVRQPIPNPFAETFGALGGAATNVISALLAREQIERDRRRASLEEQQFQLQLKQLQEQIRQQQAGIKVRETFSQKLQQQPQQPPTGPSFAERQAAAEERRISEAVGQLVPQRPRGPASPFSNISPSDLFALSQVDPRSARLLAPFVFKQPIGQEISEALAALTQIPGQQPGRVAGLPPGISVRAGPVTITGREQDRPTNLFERTAFRIFNKFKGLTPEETAIVTQDLERREGRVRAQTGLAVFQAKRAAERRQRLPADLAELTGFPSVAEGEDLGGFTFLKLDSRPMLQFRRKLQKTKTTFTEIDRLRDFVLKNPEAFGFTGALAATVEGAAAQVRNIARLVNVNLDEIAPNKLTKFEPLFSRIGLKNRRLQAKILGLVIRAAEAEGFTGRALTDRKIELFTQIVGASTQSPEAFAATLGDLKVRLDEGIRAEGTVVLGQEPGSLLPSEERNPSISEQSTVVPSPSPSPTTDPFGGVGLGIP